MIEIIPNWHPIFVHFTVALLSLSTILFLVSRVATQWRLEDQWLATAYWNLWIGVGLTVVTVAAGWYAFNTVTHDDPSHAAMLEHRNLALGAFAIFAVIFIWSIVQYRAAKKPTLAFLLAMVIAAGVLGSTAWHGAELVYRHGLGVMSLPKPDEHGHGDAHSHGEDAGHEGQGSSNMSAGEDMADDHAHDGEADDHPHDGEVDDHPHDDGDDDHAH